MFSLANYNGLELVTPEPSIESGRAINDNFKALSTHVDTLDPDSANDETQGYSVGSRWYNSTTTNEWLCLRDSIGRRKGARAKKRGHHSL
jgi:hypothetical protein